MVKKSYGKSKRLRLTSETDIKRDKERKSRRGLEREKSREI